MTDNIIVVRGGGDIATGIIQKFYRSGYNVLVLETDKPTAIRRTVSLCQAVYDNKSFVEDMECSLISDYNQAGSLWKRNVIPLLIDKNGNIINKIKPLCVIDSIIAKKNLGTNKKMAPVTIGIGPGFYAGTDVNVVIETKRGHDLGRLIFDGYALPNTGIPGDIMGKSAERVIHAPFSGTVRLVKEIGETAEKNELLFFIDDTEIKSPFKGLIRGLIQDNMYVKKNMKIADIDPRLNVNVNTISDKARCIAGGALEGFLFINNQTTQNN